MPELCLTKLVTDPHCGQHNTDSGHQKANCNHMGCVINALAQHPDTMRKIAINTFDCK